MKVKEGSEKGDLKLNIQKTKIMASGPISSWQIDGETVETVNRLYFWGAPKSLQRVTAAMKLRGLLLGRKVMTNLDSLLKSRGITLPAKVHLEKAMVFPVVMYGCRRRQWHPTSVLLPGKSHGWRSLVGYSPWGFRECDTTELLHFHFSLSCIGEGNGNPLQCSRMENPRDSEPGGLPSMGLHRVGHHWSDLAAAAACMDVRVGP